MEAKDSIQKARCTSTHTYTHVHSELACIRVKALSLSHQMTETRQSGLRTEALQLGFHADELLV